MCNFVSWKEYKGNVYFLTNADLETKEGKKLLQKEYRDDLQGHGAIEHYYPELAGKGINKECEDFSSPDNFPKEIAKALIEGKMSNIGITLDILNNRGRKEYLKIIQSAWNEYQKIEQSAWKKYKKTKQPAWKKYDKIAYSAYQKYLKITQSAWEEYEKIQQSAWEEYEKIQQPAWKEYDKIDQSALEKYEKIVQSAWREIVKQSKYRKKEWKAIK